MFLSVDNALHDVDENNGTHWWEDVHATGLV